MFLILPAGETFAPIGATGEVYWGMTTGNIRGVLSGSWEMVAPSPVPEPLAASMMLGGLALLVSLTRRRSRKFDHAMR